jgi:predicted MFS family arabinose efflux permease
LASVLLILVFVTYNVLPNLAGEKRTKKSSPIWIIKKPQVLIVLLVTLLSVLSHYALYTYLAPFVQGMQLTGGVSFALLLFGIGTIIGVMVTGKMIDFHLRKLVLMMFLFTLIAMFLFNIFKSIPLIIDLSIILWGLSFGGLPTILQTAVSRQVDTGKDVLTSIQTTIYNLAIFGGALIGGFIQNRFTVYMIVYLVILLMSIAIVCVSISKRAFAK